MRLAKTDTPTAVRPPFSTRDVESVFTQLTDAECATLLAVRARIYQLAEETPGVGSIEESLKWGSPSYATVSPRTGTPLRLDRCTDEDNTVGVYVHCQSRVMEHFNLVHGNTQRTLSTRALLLRTDTPVPAAAVDDFVLIALTYRLRTTR